MINVLMFSPNDNDGVSYYRHWGPMLELERLGHIKLIAMSPDSKQLQNWQYYKKADVAFITRPARNHDFYFIKECQKYDIPLWVDIDDNLFAIPDDNSSHNYYSSEDAIKFVMFGLRSAKIISVATQRLQDFLTNKMALETTIVPNGIEDRIWSKRRKFELNKNIMWRGSQSKLADLLHFNEAIRKGMRENQNWHFYGLNPFFIRNYIKNGREFIKYTEPMNFIDYMIKIREFEPSVNIVPILNHEFNQTRSNISWIEATHAGAVTLAPSWPEWQRPGIINYDTERDFSFKLSTISSSYDLKERWQISEADINDNFLLSKINNLRLEILHNLIS